MIRLQRVIHALPAGFAAMRAEARAEGFGMLDTLAQEWEAGKNRFDREGEALYAAYSSHALAGIGGLTLERTMPGAFRMRRFYVRAAFRRYGIARQLALGLLQGIAGANRVVTCNAAAGSEKFWEALDFAPDHRDGRTHILRMHPLG